jgi:hypothetical protein
MICGILFFNTNAYATVHVYKDNDIILNDINNPALNETPYRPDSGQNSIELKISGDGIKFDPGSSGPAFGIRAATGDNASLNVHVIIGAGISAEEVFFRDPNSTSYYSISRGGVGGHKPDANDKLSFTIRDKAIMTVNGEIRAWEDSTGLGLLGDRPNEFIRFNINNGAVFHLNPSPSDAKSNVKTWDYVGVFIDGYKLAISAHSEYSLRVYGHVGRNDFLDEVIVTQAKEVGFYGDLKGKVYLRNYTIISINGGFTSSSNTYSGTIRPETQTSIGAVHINVPGSFNTIFGTPTLHLNTVQTNIDVGEGRGERVVFKYAIYADYISLKGEEEVIFNDIISSSKTNGLQVGGNITSLIFSGNADLQTNLKFLGKFNKVDITAGGRARFNANIGGKDQPSRAKLFKIEDSAERILFLHSSIYADDISFGAAANVELRNAPMFKSNTFKNSSNLFISDNITIETSSTVNLAEKGNVKVNIASIPINSLGVFRLEGAGNLELSNIMTITAPLDFIVGDRILIQKQPTAAFAASVNELHFKVLDNAITKYKIVISENAVTLQAVPKPDEDVLKDIDITNEQLIALRIGIQSTSSLKEYQTLYALSAVLSGSDKAAIADVVKQITPQKESIASIAQTALLTGTSFLTMTSQRIASLKANDETGVSAAGYGMPSPRSSWLKGMFNYTAQANKAEVPGYTSLGYGLVGGFDLSPLKNYKVGASFGFSQNKVVGKGKGQSINDIWVFQGSVYGMTDITPSIYAIAMMGYGKNFVDTRRQFTIGTITKIAKAKYDTNQYFGRLGIGHVGRMFGGVLTSLLTLDWIKVGDALYTEKGAGALGLVVKNKTSSLVHLKLKSGYNYEIQARNGRFIPAVSASIGLDVIKPNGSASMHYASDKTLFKISSLEKSAMSFGVGASLVYKSNKFDVSASYEALMRVGRLSHTGSATIRYKF